MATTEAQRAAVKRWRQRNPDKVKEMSAAWRDENREHVREYNRLYGRKRRRKAKLAERKKNGRSK